MTGLPTHRAPALVRRMPKEQPLMLAYPMAMDHDLLNEDERQLLLYLGVVVWQIISQGATPLPKVTEELLDDAESSNLKKLEYLQKESELGFARAIRIMFENCR